MNKEIKEPKKLEAGYYWIKLYPNSLWGVAYYNTVLECFQITGSIENINEPFFVDENKINKFDIEPQKSKQIEEKLESMEIGDTFNKREFVNILWLNADEFSVKSFDALLCKAKKLHPEKIFKTTKGEITRTQ